MWGSGVILVTSVMVLIEFLEVGLNTVNKAAMNRGINQNVLVVYSNALAIFILIPSSFIFYRNRSPPPLTSRVVGKILLLSLISCCGQLFAYIGVKNSSPTLASAMNDLTPGFTFLFSLILRMEKLDLRVGSSQAKSIGTTVCMAGALIVTLYKGLPITSPSTDKAFDDVDLLQSPKSKWITGGVLLAAQSVLLAINYNVQAWVIRAYPAALVISLICTLFVTIMSAIFSLITVRKDPNAWILRPDIDLIAIAYAAIFAVAFRSTVHTWASHKKGPVFVSMFKPLGMVIALAMGVAFLGDTLYLGSLIGAAVIAIGFYAVIWGRAQEEIMVEDTEICTSNFQSSSAGAPLLLNKNVEI